MQAKGLVVSNAIPKKVNSRIDPCLVDDFVNVGLPVGGQMHVEDFRLVGGSIGQPRFHFAE